MALCTVCDGPVNPRAKNSGLCAPHYRRKLAGKPLDTPFQQHAPSGTPAYDKVMALTARDGECLVFTGPCDRNGYGRIALPGVKRSKTVLPHRVVMEHHFGASDLDVLHSCDNPPCVNIAHLRYGTAKDNVADMNERGTPGGRFQPRITDDEVRAIRTDRRPQVEIAADYGTSQSYVSHIKSGKARPKVK